jgi:23S rRNA (cytidine1920-2'-O)/16S rRNA (cytidine1409-2'-O)-methyltransferase
MRIDKYLLFHFNVESRSKAQWLIENGKVKLNGKIVEKGSVIVHENDKIELENEREYQIGRGYTKLKNFLLKTDIDLNNKIVLDAGASTGGFSACALDFGAKMVYAVDVGTNQLHTSLKNHPQVISMENTDIRNFDFNKLEPPPDTILMDLSFISILKIIPVFYSSCLKKAEYIVLIKPQFETGKKLNMKNGIITSASKRNRILTNILLELKENYPMEIKSVEPTLPEESKSKNVEYFINFRFK